MTTTEAVVVAGWRVKVCFATDDTVGPYLFWRLGATAHHVRQRDHTKHSPISHEAEGYYARIGI